MKKIFLLVTCMCYLLCSEAIAQDSYESKKLYVSIPDKSKVPKVNKKADKKDEVELQFAKKDLNEALKKYKVKSFKRAFPAGKSQKVKNIYMIEIRENEDQDIFKDLMENYAEYFKYIEEVSEPIPLATPNDFGSIPSGNNTHLDLINAREAWDVTQGDTNIRIGIADSYIEITHSDLATEIDSVLENGSSTSGIAYHGVGVAGCASGATNNSNGMSSIGFKTRIMFNRPGLNDLLELAYAGAKVINLSYLYSCSPIQAHIDVIDEMDSLGVLLVSGAGNNNTSHCGALNAPIYPCAYDKVMCVTSVGHANDTGYVDPIYGANNWKGVHPEIIGDTTTSHHHYAQVDVCAPGYNVKSTYLNDSYDGFWGTSFAAPMVAGVCGLVLSVNPCFTPAEVLEIVKSTADTSIYQIPENTQFIGGLGTGLVDAGAAVREARKQSSEFVQDDTITTTQTVSGYYGVYVGYAVTDDETYGNVYVNSSGSLTLEANHEVVLSGGLEVDGGELIIDMSTSVPNSCGF